MRRIILLLAALAAPLCVSGCDTQVRVGKEGTSVNSGSEGGFSLEIPGVDVKVKDGRVDVKAPGTDVRVDTNKGDVSVDAPNTRVRRKADGKVEVDAPGTTVDVE